MKRHWTPEERYEFYVAYCRLVGVPPMPFQKWLALSESILASTARMMMYEEVGAYKLATA